MDSLNDILTKDRFTEPPEIQVIKDYVLKHLKADVNVKLQPKQIVIFVNNAALAGSLRMQLFELKQLLKTDKRLVIFIGKPA